MLSSKAKAHTDIKSDGWIEQYLPSKMRPCAYLIRLDRPIGIWLLLLPAWWAITLAAGGMRAMAPYDWWLMMLFGAGAVIMRGAGCIINDLWDRKLDQTVARTNQRPLASGAITPPQALLFLFVLLLLGLFILTQMTLVTILLGVLALPLIIAYPLMKRITWWPQAFLGLTFNFGALMGWSAVTHLLALPALLLYAGGFFWTLGYDTIYAHQDKEDDAKTGIKSSALKLGTASKKWIAGFYAIAMSLYGAAFLLTGAGVFACLLLSFAAIQLIWQIRIWNMGDPASALLVFKSNRDFGIILLLAALL